MCGICGAYSFDRAIYREFLEAATRSLAHRGPDGMSVWTNAEGTVGLGHTRLAIIDLVCGQQPMHSVDGRYVIVFNGEIFNYRDLRAELEGHGYAFRTHSDTEVLLNAYHKWGNDCLIRLDGMFAFAIFDKRDQRLLLVRDRTGIKPLYYHHDGDGIVFGSELKALLVWPHVPRRVHRYAIRDFLMMSHSVPPDTCFRDCRELEPGCYMELSTNSHRQGRYWSWSREEGTQNGNDPINSLEQEMKSAVRAQLVSDVPIGAFLSGGIDSSLVVSLAAEAGGARIKTFNVRFGEPAYDESHYARAVAAHAGTDHHEIHVDKLAEGPEFIETILSQFDQPFGDSSAIPTYLICREIRNHVKVVLGGDGGDEMFGGYERFAYADVVQQIARWPRFALGMAENLARGAIFLSRDRRRQLLRLLKVAQVPPSERLVALSSIIQRTDFAGVFQPDFLASLSNGETSNWVATLGGGSGGAELIDFTVNHRLPGDYLKKIDVMSSAHGLEVRVPMLSNRILNFAKHLPRRLKYSLVKNKILLRRLAERYLPPEVANKRKQGFGIPLDAWLGRKGREELSSYLASPNARIREIFRSDYVQKLMNQFATGEWDRTEISRYTVYQRAYALWSLESWLQKWKPSL